MAQPKKKTSRSKRNSRRQHWKAELPNLVACPRCHEKKLTHVVCMECGYYRSKEVFKMPV